MAEARKADAASSDALLRVEDLRTWFHTFSGTVKAVDGVSFAVKSGEIMGLVGESGAANPSSVSRSSG